MKIRLLSLILLAVVLLTGCRTRTTAVSHSIINSSNAGAVTGSESAGVLDGSENGAGDEIQRAADSSSPVNPESERKVYDINADAEVIPGAAKTIDSEGGEGSHPFSDGLSDDHTEAQLNSDAVHTSTMTVVSESSDRLTASQSGTDETSFTYYSVLLNERVSTLFECKKLYIYLEQSQDYLTVHKSSPEHSVILTAGAYDVSQRLLEENLTVTPGWISRKSPDAAIKLVSRGTINTAPVSAYTAFSSREEFSGVKHFAVISEELMLTPPGRVAASLITAAVCYPDLFSDIELSGAVSRLLEESGIDTSGDRFYYYE